MRFQASRTFIPSQYSSGYGAYGADDEEEGEEEEPITTAENAEQQSTSEMLTKYAPFLQSVLGFGGAADKAAKLKSRLRTLRGGGPGAALMSVQICGVCSLKTAIKRTEDSLAAAEAEAYKASTRDTLYTALTVTGVLAGGMFVLWLGTKAWGGYQETKIQQEKLKRLQAGG